MPSSSASALVVPKENQLTLYSPSKGEDPKWKYFWKQLLLWGGNTLLPMVQPEVKDWVQRRQNKWLNSAYNFVGGGLWLGAQWLKIEYAASLQRKSVENHRILEALQKKFHLE